MYEKRRVPKSWSDLERLWFSCDHLILPLQSNKCNVCEHDKPPNGQQRCTLTILWWGCIGFTLMEIWCKWNTHNCQFGDLHQRLNINHLWSWFQHHVLDTPMTHIQRACKHKTLQRSYLLHKVVDQRALNQYEQTHSRISSFLHLQCLMLMPAHLF